MSTTQWAITQDGEPLTWTKMVRLGNMLPSDRWQDVLAECPLQFDRAESLSSRQAQDLLVWLKSWMPETDHGLRLVPSLPTAATARMGRELRDGFKAVRV